METIFISTYSAYISRKRAYKNTSILIRSFSTNIRFASYENLSPYFAQTVDIYRHVMRIMIFLNGHIQFLPKGKVRIDMTTPKGVV